MYCRVPGTKTGVDLAYSFHSFEDPYFSTCLFSSPPVARRMMETIWEGPITENTQWYLDGNEKKTQETDRPIGWNRSADWFTLGSKGEAVCSFET